MTTLTLFKSRAGTMGYVFKNGKTVHFMGGTYATSAPEEIEELTKECEAGHPNYYIDVNQTTIDSELMDPMAVLVARIREEERAKLIAATDKSRDMGKVEFSGKLEGIANSHTIQGAMAHSDSQASAPVSAPIHVAATATNSKK
jgi:hypothetical protein